MSTVARLGARVSFGAALVAGLVGACETGSPSRPVYTSDASVEDPRTSALCGSPAWRELYSDWFGRGTGQPGSCTFGSDCHNGPSASGTRASGGYQCPDESTCCRTMVAANLVDRDVPRLLSIVRHEEPGPDGGDASVEGYMPLQPEDFVFPTPAFERMRAWIAGDAGATRKDDD
jgi:hypothetical protein